jgi:ceramide glucosyltransferase
VTPVPLAAPRVSILRPVCGTDALDEITLGSGFELAYPRFELIFCCAEPGDPAVRLVRRLMARYPNVDAKLLIGDAPISPNPKLNNLVKGWRAASGDWVIMADSNVLMPPDYVERLLAAWSPAAGVVCSPPIGCLPTGFFAELECAFLNTYQARWQYAAHSIGMGFAQGKTMLWRRRDLDSWGGIEALGGEIAEDAAATKIVRRLGLNPVLVDAPFGQPLGRRSAVQVWSRQARWSRLRRMTFPRYFALEIFTGSLLPIAAAGSVADWLDVSRSGVFATLALLWFGGEYVLARAAGWHLSLVAPLAWVVRDLLLPLLWAQAWLLDGFSWRGSEVRLRPQGLRA